MRVERPPLGSRSSLPSRAGWETNSPLTEKKALWPIAVGDHCATRSLLFLQEDNTLKPLAIELSLPHPDGEVLDVVSRTVFTPSKNNDNDNDGGIKESIW
ncbi:hypothetical protein IEQ34_003972 [Dendrobium chrysotoxum]|uniref:Lipoxygenase domain-containing protein n=1 Tax=Dendrobium chrysotoxum TaxID=161865 RepID=A0AAV7HF44_DENCH|nr:hypothetical protein IEQ34_003972 [Dendrobium chrysotoxum]